MKTTSNRTWFIFCVGLCLALWLTSCGRKIDKGIVVGKEYEPYRSYFIMMPVMIGKTTVMIPYVIHDDEDYIIWIEGDLDGEIVTESIYVTRSVYNSVKKGDLFCVDEGCSYKDENNTKVRR